MRISILEKIRAHVSALMMLLLLAVLVAACGENRPSDILTKDQMVILFRDYYLREARLKEGRLTEDSAVLVITKVRMDAALHSDIPDSLVERSLHYYLARPVDLNEIYDRVIDSLSLKEQRMKVGGADKPIRPR